MKHSHKILYMIIGTELIIGTVYFIYSSKGIKAINALCHENRAIENQINALQQDNAQGESQIKDWQRTEWYKEQIAREELQFAKPDESVFLYGS